MEDFLFPDFAQPPPPQQQQPQVLASKQKRFSLSDGIPRSMESSAEELPLLLEEQVYSSNAADYAIGSLIGKAKCVFFILPRLWFFCNCACFYLQANWKNSCRQND